MYITRTVRSTHYNSTMPKTSVPYLTQAHLAVQSHDLREASAVISAGGGRDPTRILHKRIVCGELGVGPGALNQSLRERKKATKTWHEEEA